MARSVLASAMLASLREATGTENDTHVTDTELYKALSRGVSDTWDAILSSGVGTEGVTVANFTAVAGTREYVLATVAATFYQLRNLYVVEASGALRPIPRINPSEAYPMMAPAQGASMKLYYFPAAPVWTTGAESFDGINGWEEHAIMCAAIHVKAKKEDDTGQYRARKRELEARMAVMANRLRDEPPRVVRRSAITRHGRMAARGHYMDGGLPYATGPRFYDIRGANLELYA